MPLSRSALALGGAAAALLLTHFAVQTWTTRQAVARLAHCLAGDTPSGRDTLPLLRRIALAEHDDPSPGGPWPDRCAGALDEVTSARMAPRDLVERARLARDRRADAPDGALPLTAELAETLTLARAFVTSPARRPGPAPRAPIALRIDDPAGALRGRCTGLPVLDPARLDPQPSHRWIFEIGPPLDRRLCTIPVSDGVPRVACPPTPEALRGASLIPGGRPDQAVFAAFDGLHADATGTTIPLPAGRTTPDRLHLTAEGAVARLHDPLAGDAGPGVHWSRGAQKLDLALPAAALLVAGHVVWASEGGLTARRVLDEAPGFGPEQAVALPIEPPLAARLRVCRHTSGWVVVTSSREPGGDLREDAGPDSLAVSFVDERGWSAPRRVERPVRLPDDRLGAWSIACSPDEAALTWVRRPGRAVQDLPTAHRVRCRRDDCVTQEQPLRGLAGQDTRAALVPLRGEAAALLWTERDFVRARVGAWSALDQAPAQTLVQGPPGLDLESSEVMTRAGRALVLLRSRDASPPFFYPLWLAPEGASPLDCTPP